MGFVVPTAVAALWGDWLGGLLYGGFMVKVFIWHSTFFINSLAHYWGSQDFSLEFTATSNFFAALLTNGEGYHNFHHQFPSDYRNGIFWYQYDITKWVICLLEWAGLASDLYQTPEEEIKRALILTAEERNRRLRDEIDWGPEDEDLPLWTAEELSQEIKKGRLLVVIRDHVHDVSKYANKHPGGVKPFKAVLGKDATEAFTIGVNQHTQAARAIASLLRVARIDGSTLPQV